jgi:ribonuclease P protein component
MVGSRRRSPLTGAGAFEAVFRNGRRRDGDYVQLVSMPAGQDRGRTGFVISRKALRLAVDRNRVRRMLRALLREAQPAIDGHDLIVRLKHGAPRADFPLIVADAARLLDKLGMRRCTS